MVKNTKKSETQLEKIAIRITEWVGTPMSIIVHTFLFIAAFVFYFNGTPLNDVLLVLTTVVSLEAIYLSLFIQLSVNKNTQSLEDVEEDIDEIQEDVEGLEGEFDEIHEDVEGLEGNIKKIRENVRDLGEDVEEISQDIDQLGSDGENQSEEELAHVQSSNSLKNIEKEILTLSSGIIALRDDLEILKRNIK